MEQLSKVSPPGAAYYRQKHLMDQATRQLVDRRGELMTSARVATVDIRFEFVPSAD
jgi:hypothetical protein